MATTDSSGSGKWTRYNKLVAAGVLTPAGRRRATQKSFQRNFVDNDNSDIPF